MNCSCSRCRPAVESRISKLVFGSLDRLPKGCDCTVLSTFKFYEIDVLIALCIEL